MISAEKFHRDLIVMNHFNVVNMEAATIESSPGTTSPNSSSNVNSSVPELKQPTFASAPMIVLDIEEEEEDLDQFTNKKVKFNHVNSPSPTTASSSKSSHGTQDNQTMMHHCNSIRDQHIQVQLSHLTSIKKDSLFLECMQQYGLALLRGHEGARDDLISSACAYDPAFLSRLDYHVELSQVGTLNEPLEISSSSGNSSNGESHHGSEGEEDAGIVSSSQDQAQALE